MALNKRNIEDKNRKISPLQKHPDAVVVDAGRYTKQAMIAIMSKYVDRVIKNNLWPQNKN